MRKYPYHKKGYGLNAPCPDCGFYLRDERGIVVNVNEPHTSYSDYSLEEYAESLTAPCISQRAWTVFEALKVLLFGERFEHGRYPQFTSDGNFVIGRIEYPSASKAFAADRMDVLQKVCRHDVIAVEEACLAYRELLSVLRGASNFFQGLSECHTPATAIPESMTVLEFFAKEDACLKMLRRQFSCFSNPVLSICARSMMCDVHLPVDEMRSREHKMYSLSEVQNGILDGRKHGRDVRIKIVHENRSTICRMCGQPVPEYDAIGIWQLTSDKRPELYDFKERPRQQAYPMCPSCAHKWMAHVDEDMHLEAGGNGRFKNVFGKAFHLDKKAVKAELAELYEAAHAFLMEHKDDELSRYDLSDLCRDLPNSSHIFNPDEISGKIGNAGTVKMPKFEFLTPVFRENGMNLENAIDLLNRQMRPLVKEPEHLTYVWPDETVKDIADVHWADYGYVIKRYVIRHRKDVQETVHLVEHNAWLASEYDKAFRHILDQFEDQLPNHASLFDFVKNQYLTFASDCYYGVKISDDERTVVTAWSLEKAAEYL